jgi:hypothetical protein
MSTFPATRDARWALLDPYIDAPIPLPPRILWRCALGALLVRDWADVRLWLGSLCERVPGLFWLYCHVDRACERPLRDLAWCCSRDADQRVIGRLMIRWWLCTRLACWSDRLYAHWRLWHYHLHMLTLRYGFDVRLLFLACLWPVLWLLLTARH